MSRLLLNLGLGLILRASVWGPFRQMQRPQASSFGSWRFMPVGLGCPAMRTGSGCVPVGFERRDQVTKNTTSATPATARRIYERITVNSTDKDPSYGIGCELRQNQCRAGR